VLDGEGWTKQRISVMLSSEMVIVWLVSMIGTGFIGIFTRKILSISWELFLNVFLWTITIGGVVIFLSAYGSTYRSFKNIFKNTRNRGKRGKSRNKLTRFLFWADISYYGNRLILMAVQILIGGALCFFSWLAISAIESDVTTTALGAFIHARVGIWLKFIGISAFLLVLLTFFDSILSYFDLRKKDVHLLKQMGWQKKDLNMVMYPQIVFPVFISSILAMTIGVIFTRLIYEESPVSIVVLIIADMILPTISILMTYIWISKLYRTDEEKVKVKKIRKEVAVASIAIIGAAIFISTGNEKKSNITTNENSIEDVHIHKNGTMALEMIEKMVALGNRPVGSKANHDEIEILCRFLEDNGLQVHREEVKVPPFRWLSESSKLTINAQEIDFYTVAADFSSTVEGKKYKIEDKTPVLIGLENIDKENVKGHIVLVRKGLQTDEVNKIIRECMNKGALVVIQTDIDGISQKIKDVKFEFEVVELYQSYNSENIWVDIKGDVDEAPFLVATNHGSTGPGAVNNASGVASLAVLAKEFKENPPSCPMRFLWAAGGYENLDGGFLRYLEADPKHSGALVLKNFGTKDKLFFGFRLDNIYGRSGEVPGYAKDVENEDLIPYVKEVPIYNSKVFDLDHPSNASYIKHDLKDIECLVTSDEWMKIAQKISREVKVDFQPGPHISAGDVINLAGIPEVDLYRPTPYANTSKDTLDKIDLETLEKDIDFAEKIIRKIIEE